MKNNNGNGRRAYEVQAEIEGLKELLQGNRAKNLTYLIDPKEGEITYIKPSDFRKLTGQRAPGAIIKVKGRRERIPWEQGLDKIATDRGYRNAQQLKNDIEKARKDREKLERLRSWLASYRSEHPMLKTKKLKAKVSVPIVVTNKRIRLANKIVAQPIKKGRETIGYLVSYPKSFGIYPNGTKPNLNKEAIAGSFSKAKAIKKVKEVLGGKKWSGK